MKPKIILSDCDGVVLDWIRGFNKFMFSKGFEEIPNTDHRYNLDKRFPITYAESRVYVKEFNESELMINLDPLPEAVEYIKKLNSKHGFKFIFITSISDNPVSYNYRKQNLENLFGNIFDELKCLPMGDDKFIELQRWKDSGLFWIEDHYINAMNGYKNGLNSVLINNPTNTEFDTSLIKRANNWKELYSIICKEYDLEE